MYYGDSIADKAMMRLNAKIKKTFAQAYREMSEKLESHTKQFEKDDKKYREMVKSGKLSQKDYNKWKQSTVFTGTQWKNMISDITGQIVHADKTTERMINGERRAVFQENVNYSSYEIDKDYNFGLTFTIYDSATVTRLIKDDPELLPDVKIDPDGYKNWSKKLVTSAVTQSIIQGETIPQTAERIGKKLSSSNEKAMTRVARTAMTSAQNSGRIEAMHNAQGMGIAVKKLWIATLDRRTRDAHGELDGQTAEVDDPFHSSLGDIYYPGDPNANPQNTWNCRCSLGWEYPEYKNQYDTRAAREYEDDEDERGQTVEVPYMTYAEWKEQNSPDRGRQESQVVETEEAEDKTAESRRVVQGKDISETWVRRPDEFAFEIEDVINAQGFDGLPRIVSAKEFDELVKEANGGNGFIAQRTYSAPDQETINAYRDQLYNGKWYVDCSTGGAQYGQGMYCAADYNGVLTNGIKNEMHHYQGLYNSRYGSLDEKQVEKAIAVAIERDKKEAEKIGYAFDEKERREYYRWQMVDMKMDGKEIETLYGVKGNNFLALNYTETITLSPDAKIITWKELNDIKTGTVSIGYLKRALNEELEKMGLSEDELKFAKYNSGQNMPWNEVNEIANRLGSDKIETVMEKLEEAGNIAQVKFEEEQENRRRLAEIYKEKYKDPGSLAASLGYDAINAEGHGESGSYSVILNRTKVIIRSPEE